MLSLSGNDSKEQDNYDADTAVHFFLLMTEQTFQRSIFYLGHRHY